MMLNRPRFEQLPFLVGHVLQNLQGSFPFRLAGKDRSPISDDVQRNHHRLKTHASVTCNRLDSIEAELMNARVSA